MVLSSYKRLFVLGLVGYVAIFAPLRQSSATPISRYADMPASSLTFTEIDVPDIRDVWNSLGIAADFAKYGTTDEFASDATGWRASLPTDPTNAIAPNGSAGLRSAVRLGFSSPIYALGGTVFASPFEFGDATAGGVSRNIGNPIVVLTAFDSSGALIEAHAASNYGTPNGPTRLIEAGTRNEVMASYVGIWSDVPIAQAIFTGTVDTSAGPARFSNLASFSFSDEPLVSVGEPVSVVLTLVGLAPLAIRGLSRRAVSRCLRLL